MSTAHRKLVLVTGPSGAGMSTATNALEDAGFEAVDNLPLRLVLPLLDQPGPHRPLSIGLDLRTRDFSAEAVLNLLAELEQHPGIELQLLYLDCSADEILRRYSSTRRRHPVMQAPTLAEGIAHEIDLLRPIRARADVLIDTSDLNPHELRADVERWFAATEQHQMAVQVQSFSYKRGLPRGADFVFDCRFLRNPHWEEDLRPLDGRDQVIRDFVAEDPRFAAFRDKVTDLMLYTLPGAQAEGKSYLTITFGCTGGKHRSVTLAETVARALAAAGWQVSTRHRELDRQPSERSPA